MLQRACRDLLPGGGRRPVADVCCFRKQTSSISAIAGAGWQAGGQGCLALAARGLCRAAGPASGLAWAALRADHVRPGPCDSRSRGPSQNSLRSLRSLRSNNCDESVDDARCARGHEPCDSRLRITAHRPATPHRLRQHRGVRCRYANSAGTTLRGSRPSASNAQPSSTAQRGQSAAQRTTGENDLWAGPVQGPEPERSQPPRGASSAGPRLEMGEPQARPCLAGCRARGPAHPSRSEGQASLADGRLPRSGATRCNARRCGECPLPAPDAIVRNGPKPVSPALADFVRRRSRQARWSK